MKRQNRSFSHLLMMVLVFLFVAAMSFTGAFAADVIKSNADEHGELGDLQQGMSDEEVIKEIGKPDKKTKPTYWGATGDYHSDWTYAKLGIKLDMVSPTPESDDITVCSITATAPCKFKTPLGVGVGSKDHYVRKMYAKYEKDEHFSNNNTLVIGSIYGGLMFKFKNGVVAEIFIGAGAE